MTKLIPLLAAALLLSPGLASAKDIYGSNKDDRIEGTDKADRIFGLKGDDTIDGRGGDDVIEGGKDRDTINWQVGEGHDTIDGEPASYGDALLQLSGKNVTRALTWSVGLSGGRLSIKVKDTDNGKSQGGTSSVRTDLATLVSGKGDDLIVVNDFSKSPDWLGELIVDGGSGNDVIDARMARVPSRRFPPTFELTGGAGDDVIRCGPGIQFVAGGPGSDAIYLNSYANGAPFFQTTLESGGVDTFYLGNAEVFFLSDQRGEAVQRTDAVIHGFKPGKDMIYSAGIDEDDLPALDSNKNGKLDGGDKIGRVRGGNLELDYDDNHLTFIGLTAIPLSSFFPDTGD